MPSPSIRKSIVPTVLGMAMLAIVIAAAVAPNTGAVTAQSSCQYNNCTSTSSTFPWVWVGAALAIVAAVLLTFLLLGRGRRRGGGSPPEAWTPPAAGATEGAAPTEATTEEPAAPAEPYDEGVPPAGPSDSGAPAGPDADIDSLMNELDKISSNGK